MNQTPTCKIATSRGNERVIKTNNILLMNWWRLVDEFRNFCMCEDTEKVYRKLEEVIGVC